jgi:hypothetical protein
MRRVGFAVILLPLVGGCLLLDPAQRTVYSPCHAISTGNWHAYVERIDVSTQKAPLHRTFLFVEGDVTAPESDSVRLERGPVQRLDDPVQQVIVRTEGPGTGTPVARRVRGRFKALEQYGSVALRCGDGIVGTIREVPRRDQ